METSPQQGESLGNDFYKVRLAISSKAKGKSGGASFISCVKVIRHLVFLTSINDKSEKTTVSNGELKILAKQIKW